MEGTPVAPYSPRLSALAHRLRADAGSAALLQSPHDNPVCALAADPSLPGLQITWRAVPSSGQLRFIFEHLLDVIAVRRVGKLLASDAPLAAIGPDDQRWIAQEWLARALGAGLRAGVSAGPLARLAQDAKSAAMLPPLIILPFEQLADARGWLQAALPVLVVEDHEQSRYVLQRLLRYEGYPSVAATNGMEALDLIAHTPPSLIITDLRMPEMDGEELIVTLRTHAATRDLPIILHSGDLADSYAIAQRFAPLTVVPKGSLDWADLYAAVRHHIGPGHLNTQLPDVPPAGAKYAG
ncbi:MAG: response regulator [Phycisphaerales bacterium]